MAIKGQKGESKTPDQHFPRRDLFFSMGEALPYLFNKEGGCPTAPTDDMSPYFNDPQDILAEFPRGLFIDGHFSP